MTTAGSRITSCGSPSARRRPKFNTTIRSARLSTAFITCSTQITVTPSWSRAVRTISIDACSSVSFKPAITSSRRSSCGRPASARASSRKRCSWRFNVPTSSSPRSARRTNPSASSARSCAVVSSSRPSVDPNRAPSTTFSRTDISANGRGVCSTMAMPAWRARCGVRRVTSDPSSRIEPPVGGSRPLMAFSSVLFPAPFGPTRARISPSSTCIVTPSTAGRPPKCFWTPSSSRIGTVVASGGNLEPQPGTYGSRGSETISVSGYHSPASLRPSGAGPGPITENTGCAAAISPHSVQLMS